MEGRKAGQNGAATPSPALAAALRSVVWPLVGQPKALCAGVRLPDKQISAIMLRNQTSCALVSQLQVCRLIRLIGHILHELCKSKIRNKVDAPRMVVSNLGTLVGTVLGRGRVILRLAVRYTNLGFKLASSGGAAPC